MYVVCLDKRTERHPFNLYAKFKTILFYADQKYFFKISDMQKVVIIF